MSEEEEYKTIEIMALALFAKKKSETRDQSLSFKLTSKLGVYDVTIEKNIKDLWCLKSYKKIS